jgi:hypothetical protein
MDADGWFRWLVLKTTSLTSGNVCSCPWFPLSQVRFELCAQALDATITTIAPWREPEFLERFKGRTDLLDYAAAHNIQVTRATSTPKPCTVALLGATLVKLSSKPCS